jgi:hypothetical protein
VFGLCLGGGKKERKRKSTKKTKNKRWDSAPNASSKQYQAQVGTSSPSQSLEVARNFCCFLPLFTLVVFLFVVVVVVSRRDGSR